MIIGYSITIFDNITTESQSKVTIAPVKNFTLTGFPINPKDDIDPGTSNSMASTTTRRPTTTTVKAQIKTMTTTVKAQTKKPLERTTSTKLTQQTETKETPFMPKITSTTEYTEFQDQSGIFVLLYNI